MKYIGITFLLLLSVLSASAQKAEREHIRRGNRLFRDSVYVDAEVNYRKAMEINSNSVLSMYNLGNALMQQNKMQDAMELYVNAAKALENQKKNHDTTVDKEEVKSMLAKAYHNIGVIWHTQKEYAKAIEAYKQALRNNPKDDETRYNLALAQKMLQDQQQDQQNQDGGEQNQENQQQQQQDQQEQQNQQDQQQEQQQSPEEQQQDNQMSKENAEQLLRAVMQDEKDVQDKVKKQQAVQGGRLEKDW